MRTNSGLQSRIRPSGVLRNTPARVRSNPIRYQSGGCGGWAGAAAGFTLPALFFLRVDLAGFFGILRGFPPMWRREVSYIALLRSGQTESPRLCGDDFGDSLSRTSSLRE